MQSAPFRLTRYFTLTSFLAFALVAWALTYLEGQQSAFFVEVQEQQRQVFTQEQGHFAQLQDEAARRDLLAVHENGSINMTRLFANALWEQHFAPFVAQAQSLDVEACRAIPDVAGQDGKLQAPPDKKACFVNLRKQLMASPLYEPLSATVFNVMQKSTVLKIKVFDLRGLTVYSSDPNQIGEDKSHTPGWKSGVSGKIHNEFTFRDKFTGFGGVVENRDLISSYLPAYAPGSDTIIGVMEVYSDVTPFLNQIKQTKAQIAQTAAATQGKVQQTAADNHAKVEQNSMLALAIVIGLLGLLYVILFGIVKRAQNLIRAQEAARETTQQRLAQSEKMAALGQMVAGVAHQLNTPLAFCKNNVQMLKEAMSAFALPLATARQLASLAKEAPAQDVITLDIAKMRQDLVHIDAMDIDVQILEAMLDDVYSGIGNMAEMVTHLKDFTRLDQSKMQHVDLNQALHSVVYLARSVVPSRIEMHEDYSDLPTIECSVSQLNQVFLNLITNAAQAIPEAGQVWVRTRTTATGDVQIEVEDTGSGIPAHLLPKIFDLYFTTKERGEGTGLGLHIAKDIVEQHRGTITVHSQEGVGTTFTVTLPAMAA